jgi:hypothetical protein
MDRIPLLIELVPGTRIEREPALKPRLALTMSDETVTRT